MGVVEKISGFAGKTFTLWVILSLCPYWHSD